MSALPPKADIAARSPHVRFAHEKGANYFPCAPFTRVRRNSAAIVGTTPGTTHAQMRLANGLKRNAFHRQITLSISERHRIGGTDFAMLFLCYQSLDQFSSSLMSYHFRPILTHFGFAAKSGN
jgi:hypothetical protein